MTDDAEWEPSPRFTAALALVGRTGASSFQIRTSSGEDPEVWVAVAIYETAAEAAAALDPEQAVLRLAAQVIDGGLCAHCAKPTIFHADLQDQTRLEDALGFCVYQFDPELAVYRRGCE